MTSSEVISSGAGVSYRGARLTGLFLSQESPRGAQGPTRSQQLLREWLTLLACARPGVMNGGQSLCPQEAALVSTVARAGTQAMVRHFARQGEQGG